MPIFYHRWKINQQLNIFNEYSSNIDGFCNGMSFNLNKELKFVIIIDDMISKVRKLIEVTS